MSLADDERFLRRAIELARKGRGRVEPNPMVGCVLVRDGEVIGEGFHAQYGGPHAEPTALANCATAPRGATAYVTLEPCCHTNKQTPPCAPRLIEAGIARVVIGCLDPNPDVDSKGVAMLRAAGIEVTGPLLEPQMKQLNAPFFKQTRFRRPYVTLKWAQSRNGKVAGAGGRRTQISSPAATRAVHELRAKSDSILVGINTVLADDPQLTARGVQASRPLTRAVLDSKLLLPITSHLAADGGGIILFCGHLALRESANRAQLQQLGVRLVPAAERDGRLQLDDVLAVLNDEGSHLLIEPGPTLARSFFEANAVDRVWRIESPNDIDAAGLSAADLPDDYIRTGQVLLGGDTLIEYLNPHSPVLFAAEPSTDFLDLADAFR